MATATMYYMEQSTDDPLKLVRVFPCRCGVKHTDESEFLAHEVLAPLQSKAAAELREFINPYLDGAMSVEEFQIAIANAMRTSMDDEEARWLSFAIEWLFLDYSRSVDDDVPQERALAALRRNLERMAAPPRLAWVYPAAEYEAGEQAGF